MLVEEEAKETKSDSTYIGTRYRSPVERKKEGESLVCLKANMTGAPLFLWK